MTLTKNKNKKHNGVQRCFQILKSEGILYSNDPRFETTHVVANSIRILKDYYGVPIESQREPIEGTKSSYRIYKFAYQ